MGLKQTPADPGNQGLDTHIKPSLSASWARGDSLRGPNDQDLPLPLSYDAGTGMTLKNLEKQEVSMKYTMPFLPPSIKKFCMVSPSFLFLSFQ